MVWVLIPFLFFSVIGAFLGIVRTANDRTGLTAAAKFILISGRAIYLVWAVVLAVLVLVK